MKPLRVIAIHDNSRPLYEHRINRERGQYISIRDVHLPSLDDDLLLDMTDSNVDLVVTRGFDFSDLDPASQAKVLPCITEKTVFVRFEKL